MLPEDAPNQSYRDRYKKRSTAKTAKTDLYAVREARLIDLLTQYFEKNPPERSLGSDASFNDLADEINKLPGLDEDFVSSHYLWGIWNRQTKSKNKSKEKLDAIEKFLLSRIASYQQPTESNSTVTSKKSLISDHAVEVLKNIQNEIESLLTAKPEVTEIEDRMKVLKAEQEDLRARLLQDEQIIKKLEAEKAALQNLVAPELQNSELWSQASGAMEHNNFEAAFDLLHAAAAPNVLQTSQDFYVLGKLKELSFQFKEALNYYELAANILPPKADFLEAAATCALFLGHCEKAISYYERTLAALDAEANKDVNFYHRLVTIYGGLGATYEGIGNLNESIEYFEEALGIADAVLPEGSQDFAVLYMRLGHIYRRLGDYELAKSNLESAHRIIVAIFGEDDVETAFFLNKLGLLLTDKEEYPEAQDCFEKSLKIYEQHEDAVPWENAEPFVGLGHICRANGDYRQGLDYYLKAFKLFSKHLDDGNTICIVAAINVSRAYQDVGELDNAFEYGQLALTGGLSQYHERHFYLGMAYDNLGRIHYMREQYRKGLASFQEALKLKQFLGDEEGIASSNYWAGKMFVHLKEYKNARQYLESSLKTAKKLFGNESLAVADILQLLSQCYASAKQFRKATLSIATVQKIYSNKLGPNHRSTIEADQMHSLFMRLKIKFNS